MDQSSHALIAPRINISISMISIKWGDVLSVLLPGSVAVFAGAQWFPTLWDLIKNINQAQLSTGVAFLFLAAIAGGILDGITRISWEKWLDRKNKAPRVTNLVTLENLPLYEFVVQNSYKYVTFYANLAFAVLLLTLTYCLKPPSNFRLPVALLLGSVVGILFGASYVQWNYFVGHLAGLFPPKGGHVTEPPSGRNKR